MSIEISIVLKSLKSLAFKFMLRKLKKSVFMSSIFMMKTSNAFMQLLITY